MSNGSAPHVTLRELATRVNGVVVGAPETPVPSITQDSRRVEPGALFVVRRGARVDGRAYVPQAVAAGAVAVMTDDHELARSLGVPALLVADVRAVLGEAAAAVYGRVGEGLALVGITGTNGKTTTAHLVSAMLAAAGQRPAVLGTLGCSFEGVEEDLGFTTPEADALARLASSLQRRGASHLVMEVSSHALALGRVEGARFSVAAFTNLSQDHLDFHHSMHAYGEAKARLFTSFSPRFSVLNIDDAFGAALASRATGEVIRVSARASEATDLALVGGARDAAGVWQGVVRTRHDDASLSCPLLGAHNLENVAVALGVVAALGVDLSIAARALATAPQVPGRLERCSTGDDDVLVVVDYAHTPDALTRVLAALRPLTAGALWCVFGCGGDRDAAKRAPMGAAVAQAADRAIVTNDNPRSEDPAQIAYAIEQGLTQARGRYEIVLDRSEAITRAVCAAAPGDVVLIAGKGHEPYQLTGGVSRAFDDRVEARRALSERRRQA